MSAVDNLAGNLTGVADRPVRLARLGGALRAHGVATTLRDELDGADALHVVDGEDQDEVRLVLRVALKIPRPAWDTFQRLFGVFWSGQEPPAAPPPTPPRHSSPTRGGPALRWDPETRRLLSAGSDDAPGGEQPGYSPEVLLRRKSFDQMTESDRDLPAMERLLARLAQRLAAQRSRRLQPARGGRGRPDVRRSYRRALATSGEIINLARRERAPSDTRLVFLCDTSGSMDAFTRFLLTFALAVRRVISRAEVFAFNTELNHLSPSLAPGKVRLTLDRLAAAVPDWSGGTRIGACLEDFGERYLSRFVDSKTVVVILSDGLDRGDPDQLAGAVARIQRRARSLIWLNPLLGDPRYEPTAAGMQAALPFVDHLAAAHNLESLERLLPHLAI